MSNWTQAPDGSYVGGSEWTMAPDGTYFGGTEWTQLQMALTWVAATGLSHQTALM